MPKRKKIFVGLTLDPDIVEQCKKIAESKDRSFSYYVNKILGQELLNVNKPTDRKPIKKEKEETQQYRFWKMFEPNKKEILKYTKNAKKISEDLFLANVEKNHVGNQYPFNQRDKLTKGHGEIINFMEGMTFSRTKVNKEVLYLIEYYGAIFIFRHTKKEN